MNKLISTLAIFILISCTKGVEQIESTKQVANAFERVRLSNDKLFDLGSGFLEFTRTRDSRASGFEDSSPQIAVLTIEAALNMQYE
jgi:hypothetical protein